MKRKARSSGPKPTGFIYRGPIGAVTFDSPEWDKYYASIGNGKRKVRADDDQLMMDRAELVAERYDVYSTKRGMSK